MKDNGGPAFPLDTYNKGMSLRDYFAAQAIAKVLDTSRYSSDDRSMTIDAARCWRFADAMIAERDK